MALLETCSIILILHIFCERRSLFDLKLVAVFENVEQLVLRKCCCQALEHQQVCIETSHFFISPLLNSERSSRLRFKLLKIGATASKISGMRTEPKQNLNTLQRVCRTWCAYQIDTCP